VFDRGGYLPPGLTLAYNGTGHNEYVLTDEQLNEARSGGMEIGIRVHDGAVSGLVAAQVDRAFGTLADANIYGGA
jgi:hypothetical protein